MSFKFRLLAYFLFLSLLPLAAATNAFNDVLVESETNRVDSRLASDLRLAVAEFSDVLEDAEEEARALARSPDAQRAFARRDRERLVRLAKRTPGTAFVLGRTVIAGSVERGAVRRSVAVLEDGRRIGTVIAGVPLDDGLVARLAREAGLDESADRLLVAREDRVVAGLSAPSSATELSPAGKASDVRLGDREYRAVASGLVADAPDVTVIAATPRSSIDAAVRDLRKRLLVGSLAAILVVAAIAYVIARSIVRSLAEVSRGAAAIAGGRFSERVRARGRDEFAALGQAFNDMASQLSVRADELAAERRRSRDALARFGETLAATHDPDRLLRVVVEGAIEATGAARASLVAGGDELASAGEATAFGESLRIPLPEGETTDVLLLLYAPAGGSFSDDAREAARLLAAQAAVALENARLHEIVKRQAVTDELTGLANRRRFIDALALEVDRAKRSGAPLALVLADLDDFKQVNDRLGHAAGDLVLRAFADVLRCNVRGIDVAARLGGEEFALLLPETDVPGAARLARRLRDALTSERVRVPGGERVTVTSSFGVAAYPDARTADELLGAADAALYRAKAEGKDRVVAAPGTRRVPSTS